MLIGGVFMLASIFIIGGIFVMGYLARLMRNVIGGVTAPLPEWDDLGDYFAEGLRLFGVALLYMLPIFVIAMAAIIPAAIAGSFRQEEIRQLGGGLAGCVWCLVVPLSLALSVWVPAALLFAVVEQNFAAGFNFRRIWDFIKGNVGNYILAVVVFIVARFAAGFGVILFCVGVFITVFWSMVVGAYAIADVYRLSSTK